LICGAIINDHHEFFDHVGLIGGVRLIDGAMLHRRHKLIDHAGFIDSSGLIEILVFNFRQE
jgi:hypothetical protein